MGNCQKMKLAVVFSIVLLLAGCAAGSSFVRPGYDFRSLGKVGVVVSESPAVNSGQRKELADLFAMDLLQRGFDVVDRSNLSQLFDEQIFRNESDIASPEGRSQLRIHNISGMVVVNVSELGQRISMTAKLIDVDSGSLLWMGEGTGDLKRGLTTLTGLVAGSATGAGVGSAAGGPSGTRIGGVAGAATGGIVGYGLEPNEAQLARRVIKKICRDLPYLEGK